jgi:hypothetical protein
MVRNYTTIDITNESESIINITNENDIPINNTFNKTNDNNNSKNNSKRIQTGESNILPRVENSPKSK